MCLLCAQVRVHAHMHGRQCSDKSTDTMWMHDVILIAEVRESERPRTTWIAHRLTIDGVS